MKGLTNKEILKWHQAMTNYKIKCECGHSVIIPPKLDKVICDWCGNYVFRDKKEEFKYKMKSRLKNGKSIKCI